MQAMLRNGSITAPRKINKYPYYEDQYLGFESDKCSHEIQRQEEV